MDDRILDTIRDLTRFAPAFFTIRTKSGTPQLFELNAAQLYIHKRLEDQLRVTGKVRAIILKGRQQGCCFGENMKVLTADYRWIKIADVKIGDRLVACDEEFPGLRANGRKQSRKFRTAIVEDKREFIKMAYEICFDNGARIEVTNDHRMLCRQRGGDRQEWRLIGECKLGDLIRIATNPPNYDSQSYEDGWMGGIIDGEGSARTGKGAKRISVHQTQGAVLDRMKSYFDSIGMPYKEVIDRRTRCGQNNKLGDKPVHRLDIHRLPYLIELFSRCRPTRFTNNEWHVGHELPGKAAQDGIKPWATIISIKPLKKQRVIDLQTSTKTYICEGLVSHNSTYIQSRYFHKVITSRGKKAFILTHEAEATKNLFEMTKRYYDQLPEGLCPKADKSSAKELRFTGFDSGYSVGTAGNKGTGRSQTIQLFHGSEVAFWEHTDEHATGVLQAIAGEAGTEIILESTANGIGNYFHKMWTAAMGGGSDYQAIFVPWYWQREYTRNTPGFKLSDDEQELLTLYSDDGLTTAHIEWRRIKISDLSGDPEVGHELFKQEYPMTAEEAFRNPIDNVFIASKYVIRARKSHVESEANLIIGVDPAIGNNDRTSVIRRRGRHAYKLECFRNHNTMEVAGRIVTIIKEEKPSKVFIDCIGIGAGVVDRLKEMGFDCVEGVNVARTPNLKDKFRNLRAELYWELRDWLMQEMPVQIPDSDELHGDLCGFGFKHTSNGLLQIEGKDQMKARGMPSPDTADSLMLTFYSGAYALENAMAPNVIRTPRPGMFI